MKLPSDSSRAAELLMKMLPRRVQTTRCLLMKRLGTAFLHPKKAWKKSTLPAMSLAGLQWAGTSLFPNHPFITGLSFKKRECAHHSSSSQISKQDSFRLHVSKGRRKLMAA